MATLRVPQGILSNRNGFRLGWTPWDNCSFPAILDYPDPNFPPGYSAVLASLVLLVSCIALARICGSYFFPAVHILVKKWGLKGDVVTAVIYASVASWPELAISIITVFETQQAAVGVGTIIGTSVFNTLAIPAAYAFTLSKSSRADPLTTTRDTLMAAISFSLLALILRDSVVGRMEALLMLFLYAVYICVLKCCPVEPTTKLEKEEECQPLHCTDKYYAQPLVFIEEKSSRIDELPEKAIKEPATCCARTSSRVKKLLSVSTAIITWPIKFLLMILLPPAEKFPFITALLGVVYISLIIFVIAWMITTLGYDLNVPNSFLSLTVLSVGMGYPDLISSLKVAERGTSSEVLSNALGASTFNILVSLGLPWFIKSWASPDDAQGSVFLNFQGGMYSVDIMLGTVLMLYVTLAANSFEFNKAVGCVCIGIYFFFLIIVGLLEFNVFFLVNKPLCDIKDYYNDPS